MLVKHSPRPAPRVGRQPRFGLCGRSIRPGLARTRRAGFTCAATTPGQRLDGAAELVDAPIRASTSSAS